MRVSIVLLSLVLVACGGSGVTVADAPASGSGAVATQQKQREKYLPYTERGVNLRGGGILFFAKDGDPFSAAHDKILQALYESGSVSVTTYRVDYGSSTGARLRYGVVVEDTFVLLGPSGERVASLVHPSEEDISILVRGRLPLSPSSQ